MKPYRLISNSMWRRRNNQTQKQKNSVHRTGFRFAHAILNSQFPVGCQKPQTLRLVLAFFSLRGGCRYSRGYLRAYNVFSFPACMSLPPHQSVCCCRMGRRPWWRRCYQETVSTVCSASLTSSLYVCSPKLTALFLENGSFHAPPPLPTCLYNRATRRHTKQCLPGPPSPPQCCAFLPWRSRPSLRNTQRLSFVSSRWVHLHRW